MLLLQLMLNNLNALERTLGEFQTIVDAAGFKIQKVYRTRGQAGSMYSHQLRTSARRLIINLDPAVIELVPA